MKIDVWEVQELVTDKYCVDCMNRNTRSSDWYQTGNYVCDECECIITEDGAELTCYAFRD